MRKTSSPGFVRLTTLDAIRKTIQHDIAELRKAVATANHTITIANANLERLEKLVDVEKQPDLVSPPLHHGLTIPRYDLCMREFSKVEVRECTNAFGAFSVLSKDASH